MKHEMKLQQKYYDFIKNGTKRIEIIIIKALSLMAISFQHLIRA